VPWEIIYMCVYIYICVCVYIYIYSVCVCVWKCVQTNTLLLFRKCAFWTLRFPAMLGQRTLFLPYHAVHIPWLLCFSSLSPKAKMSRGFMTSSSLLLNLVLPFHRDEDAYLGMNGPVFGLQGWLFPVFVSPLSWRENHGQGTNTY
jgi:hypothetical protein